MLVIADAQAPSCIAGIMGGLNSEIKEDTTDLFLESAKFRRDSVRHTGRALGMRTESSARFEKGVDVLNVEYAMERALQLIDELNAGDIIDGVIDRHEPLPEPRVLHVTVDSINGLLGLDIPAETMVNILNSLLIQTTLKDNTLTCAVPSFRDDVEGRADLAEEIMRIYGYDHIVSTPMKGSIVRGKRLPERIHNDQLKSVLTAREMREITTYSFISSKAMEPLHLTENDPRRQAVTLLNPLGDEYSVLRSQMITSMMTVLSTNYNRKNPAVRFFEVGKLFIPKSLPLTEKPDEVPALSLGIYGKDEDFFTLKGIIEGIFDRFGVKADYAKANEPYLHPGRQAIATIKSNSIADNTIAVFGEVHPDTAAYYGMDTRVYVAEIRLTPLYTAANQRILYKPLPRYPAVERDLALLCDEELPVAEIEKSIRSAGGKILESVNLFDVYQGTQITAGKKSVAYSLMFRSPNGTLTDTDIDPVLCKIFGNLKEKGCILRS